MSFARFSTDDRHGPHPRLRGRGRVHRRSARNLRRRRRGARFRSLQKLLRYICENGFEHHVAANLSATAAAPCTKPPRKYLGWDDVLGTKLRENPMSIVAGVDFGTLSVRVSIFDSEAGGWAPAWRNIRCTARRTIPTTPPRATRTTCARWSRRRARPCASAGVAGDEVEAHGPRHHRFQRHPGGREPRAARRLLPLVRPPRLAARRPRSPRRRAHASLEAIEWCGGVYSSEWGFAKLLHWLRHNPDKRARLATALEHCDMVAAVLCGITDPAAGAAQRLRHGPQVDVERRRSAGLPPEEFLAAVDPLLAGVRAKLGGRVRHLAISIAGQLSGEWAGEAGAARRHPDPGGRLRRALGRHRRRRPRRRRGQRGGHLHLHHGDQRRSRS